MHEIAVLHPHALVVLGFLVELDVFEFGLESKSITHLVEEEGNHDVAQAVVRLEARLLGSYNTGVELVTVGQRGREVATQQASEIEPGFDLALAFRLVQSPIVTEVVFVVNGVNH